MLQLNAEQVQALQAIKRTRDIRQLSDTLALAFPDVPGRLGDRYGALIGHGVLRAATHGLDHAVCVARYLACWFMLGAEFETKPEHAWAQEMLAPPGRPQGSKVFQLCRRTREALSRLGQQGGAAASGVMTPAVFDQAIALLDQTLMPRGQIGSLLPPQQVQLGEACDIDVLDLRLIDPAPGRQLHQYTHDQGQWRRLPVELARLPITITAGTDARQPAPTLPTRLNLLSQSADLGHTRLRLRTRASHVCDPKVHPLVSLNGPQGINEWRGMHAADITFNLYADPGTPTPDDVPKPTIALDNTPPQLSQLSLGGCGLRETGQPLGEQTTQLAVYPAEQHLMAWRRDPAPLMSWPEPEGSQTNASQTRCRIERDGVPLDVSRWQVGLEDLDRQLIEGLGRLATAWERESGVSRGRMQAEPAVFCGNAGLSWGWAEHPQGLAATPFFRLLGVIELVACQLNLRLGGELALHGSLSNLALHCSAREVLSVRCERRAGDADLLEVLKPALTVFRHPFVLQLETLAPEQATLLDVAGPVSGALVGACGLRPRKAGPGWQWFCELSIEPVSVALHVHDPLLGQISLIRPLLPAMKLLDWSLG